MIKVLSENTLVPLTLVGAVLGGAFWLTMVYANGIENKDKIEKLQVKTDDRDERINAKLDLILDRMARLESHGK